MEGISSLLQNKMGRGLRLIVLAYITDLVNVKLGEEDKADQAPAYQVLKSFFGVRDNTFQTLKALSREITDRNQPFNPNDLLDKLFATIDKPKKDILSLSTHEPTAQQLKSIRPRFFELAIIEAPTRAGQTDRNKLSTILDNLLVKPELAKFLPNILTDQVLHILSVFSENYYILAFFDENEWPKIKAFREREVWPTLPGLIKGQNDHGSVLFKVEGSRNSVFRNSQVSNSYSFELGKDSTILLINHKQSLNLQGQVVDYTIGLAYMISFGDEIAPNNLYGYLGDLVAYSFKEWRTKFG
jgi:hypothetical protein